VSNSWLRLWHDMPTDPKWRTIARASGQRIGDVMAVFNFILVDASANATERGRTQSFNAEDVATALDLNTPDVEAIVAAMQSRVMDGNRVMGWEKRQPLREDGSAERAKAWRDAQKQGKSGQPNAGQTDANAVERKRPLDADADADKEEVDTSLRSVSRRTQAKPRTNLKGYTAEFEAVWASYPKRPGNSKADAFKAWNARLTAGATVEQLADGTSRYAAYCDASDKTGTEYVKLAATFFGPGEHYLADWTVSEVKPTPAPATQQPLTVPSNAAERTAAELAAREVRLDTPEARAANDAARREAMSRFKRSEGAPA
jgi:hypothetical protein